MKPPGLNTRRDIKRKCEMWSIGTTKIVYPLKRVLKHLKWYSHCSLVNVYNCPLGNVHLMCEDDNSAIDGSAEGCHIHWKPRVNMMSTFSSMVVPKVVTYATYSATSDDKSWHHDDSQFPVLRQCSIQRFFFSLENLQEFRVTHVQTTKIKLKIIYNQRNK